MLKTMSSKNGKASIVVRQLPLAFSRSERNNMLKVGELPFKVECMIIIIILSFNSALCIQHVTNNDIIIVGLCGPKVFQPSLVEIKQF